MDEVARLRALTMGFRISQAIHVAAELGLADQIDEEPVSATDLADRLGCDPDSLTRLLRALGAVEVFVEHEDGRFAHSDMSRALRSDHPRSARAHAVFIGQEHHWATWGSLLHSVRTGEIGFRARHGTDVWTYRAARPDQGAIFDAAMSALTRQLASVLGGSYDFTDVATAVDLGGGDGTLLLGLLSAHPHLRGVLFDQPQVIERARAGIERSEAGERCHLVGGSIFEDVPEGGDVYLMRHILHDWSDEACVVALERCRDRLTGTAVLLVLERLLEGPNLGADTKLSDLTMLVMLGGRERSEAEFAALFSRAGLQLRRTLPTVSGEWILEAVRS